jgi:hypothetical protein
MSTETTFKTDGSYHNAVETGRNYVQLFPADQSNDAGVWQVTYRQNVSTFRSVAFPLTTITHATYSRTLSNPNTGALVYHYLVGETINSIVDGTLVDFTRTYAPEISDIETVAAQSISIPDWNGLEESGTYSATIDNRRTAIYTARKAVTAISELQEIETINATDIKATIHGTLDWDGTTSDLTQSVDDIWSDLYLTNVVSVQKGSTKIRLNTNKDDIDAVDLSVSGLSAGVGYIVSKVNATGASYAEIEFVYTRSIVQGTLTLQSRDPKIIYENTDGNVTGWTANGCTLVDSGTYMTATLTGSSGGISPATPTAPSSGVFLFRCEVYIPSSGGVSYAAIATAGGGYGENSTTTKDAWVPLSFISTGPFKEANKWIGFAGTTGEYVSIRNIKFETIDRTVDLSDTTANIIAALDLAGSCQSVIKDSESVRILLRSTPAENYPTVYFCEASWLSASVAGATSYVSHTIETEGNELRIIFADERQVSEITTNPQSVRTLTVSSHGFIQGDIVALFAGDTLVGVTTCSAVIDTNNFQIPANALPGKDDIVTHVGDKSTQSTFSSYPQTVLVTTTKKVYIPGVTSGVDSLNDIPVRQGLDTPQSWLIAITEGLVTAQIEGTTIEHPYPGLYIATESEFAMADVLNQTDSFLADIDGTLLMVDW